MVNGPIDDGIEEVCQAVRACGVKAVPSLSDVSDPQACADLVALTVKELGSIDILINNAGIIRRSPAADYSAEGLGGGDRDQPERGLPALPTGGREMLARGSGKIINIASLLAFQGGILVPLRRLEGRGGAVDQGAGQRMGAQRN